ncbi:hypothetical protein [Ehrlichia chaffeensis]|uniref:hypothetical protein n=1 Tax=Ehrlichia chaffeensis TaxID=945 RepID=UPI001E3BA28F|nr:hypothetical protein [Ehrlichia chaffeensis]
MKDLSNNNNSRNSNPIWNILHSIFTTLGNWRNMLANVLPRILISGIVPPIILTNATNNNPQHNENSSTTHSNENTQSSDHNNMEQHTSQSEIPVLQSSANLDSLSDIEETPRRNNEDEIPVWESSTDSDGISDTENMPIDSHEQHDSDTVSNDTNSDIEFISEEDVLEASGFFIVDICDNPNSSVTHIDLQSGSQDMVYRP